MSIIRKQLKIHKKFDFFAGNCFSFKNRGNSDKTKKSYAEKQEKHHNKISSLSNIGGTPHLPLEIPNNLFFRFFELEIIFCIIIEENLIRQQNFKRKNGKNN